MERTKLEIKNIPLKFRKIILNIEDVVFFEKNMLYEEQENILLVILEEGTHLHRKVMKIKEFYSAIIEENKFYLHFYNVKLPKKTIDYFKNTNRYIDKKTLQIVFKKAD